MLTVLGSTGRTCEGVSRRAILRAGGLSLFGGLVLNDAARAKGEPSVSGRTTRQGKVKSVILIDLFGGPSHIDMFDLKPDAPVEVRGEFSPIASSVPGLQVCEHLPKLAEWMNRVTLIRTLSHGYNSHNPYAVMTGFTGGMDREDYYSRPTDFPSMGSVATYFGLGQPGLPPYVMLPAFPGYSQSLRRAGPYGGFLGRKYDPLFSTCDPKLDKELDPGKDFYNDDVWAIGDPKLPSLDAALTADALDRRRSLLQQFDEHARLVEGTRATKDMANWQRAAFDLLLSPKVRGAFDLSQEDDATRDRYGRDLFGSSTLMARRLVEHGVTSVTIHTESKANGHWDTHNNNFKMLRNLRLPYLDRSLVALFEDLKTHGLWDSTLVVVCGDMGRTPKVNKAAGRDHWPQCGFALLAGGAMKPGCVYGTSDKQAAYPIDFPVSPGDLCATIYELLGISHEATVPDSLNRPHHISHGGQPVWDVLA